MLTQTNKMGIQLVAKELKAAVNNDLDTGPKELKREIIRKHNLSKDEVKYLNTLVSHWLCWNET